MSSMSVGVSSESVLLERTALGRFSASTVRGLCVFVALVVHVWGFDEIPLEASIALIL